MSVEEEGSMSRDGREYERIEFVILDFEDWLNLDFKTILTDKL